MFYERVCKDDSPKGLWLLSESAGATANDASGNAQNGTTKNAPTLGVPGPNPEFGAYTLNGTNQYISVPDSTTMDLGDNFTYEAWIKRSRNGGPDAIFDKGPQAAIFRFDNEDHLLLRRNSVANIAKTIITILADGLWHHVAATKNGASVHLYADGIDSTGPVTNSTCENTALPLIIGADEGGTQDWFGGSLAGMAVYGVALSEARIKAHFDAGMRRLAMVL